MKVIIDRFEGNFAVVELPDKSIINIPRKLFPQNAREGDVISIDIDKYETERRRKEIKKLTDDLFE